MGVVPVTELHKSAYLASKINFKNITYMYLFFLFALRLTRAFINSSINQSTLEGIFSQLNFFYIFRNKKWRIFIFLQDLYDMNIFDKI